MFTIDLPAEVRNPGLSVSRNGKHFAMRNMNSNPLKNKKQIKSYVLYKTLVLPEVRLYTFPIGCNTASGRKNAGSSRDIPTYIEDRP